MKEPNKELDKSLKVVRAYVFDRSIDKCIGCPHFYLCHEINAGVYGGGNPNDFKCVVEAAFDIIHQEILRIKD